MGGVSSTGRRGGILAVGVALRDLLGVAPSHVVRVEADFARIQLEEASHDDAARQALEVVVLDCAEDRLTDLRAL